MHHLTNQEANILRAAHNLAVVYGNPDCSGNMRNVVRLALALALEDSMDPDFAMPADAKQKADAGRFAELRDLLRNGLGDSVDERLNLILMAGAV